MFIIKDVASSDVDTAYYCEKDKKFHDLSEATIYTKSQDSNKILNALQRKYSDKNLMFVEFVNEEIQKIASEMRKDKSPE